MSILIKGMEMPSECLSCDFCNPFTDGPYCRRLIRRTPKVARLKDCPLVPVPPHGRLIDADALIDVFRKIIADCQEWDKNNILPDEHIKSNRIKRAEEDFVEAVLHVKNAPTIIEAEGDE